MKAPAAFLVATALFCGESGCGHAFNANIINDLTAPVTLKIAGPRECSSSGDIAAGTNLTLMCELKRGVSITLTDNAGRTCIASPSEVRRHVKYEGGEGFLDRKYEVLRLSSLACSYGSKLRKP